MNAILEFLASKEMSFLCFILNCMLAAGAFIEGHAGWFLFSIALGALCFNNYITKKEEEDD